VSSCGALAANVVADTGWTYVEYQDIPSLGDLTVSCILTIYCFLLLYDHDIAHRATGQHVQEVKMTRFQWVRAIVLGLLVVSLIVDWGTPHASSLGTRLVGVMLLLMSVQLLIEIRLVRSGAAIPWANPTVDRRLAVAFTGVLVIVAGLVSWAIWYAPTERLGRMLAMGTLLLFLGVLPFIFAWGMAGRRKP